jgi:hypothetical protein
MLTSTQTASQWDEPIAIIGMACRYPGGVCDEVDLWRLLRDGVDAIEEIPRDRWDADKFHTAHPALLDACFHALAVAELPRGVGSEQAYVPVAIERVIVHAPLPRSVTCEIRIDAASVVAEGLCRHARDP